MQKEITVEKAMKRAWRIRWWSIPSVIIPIVFMVIVAVNEWSPWYVLLGITACLAAYWLYYEHAIRRWRIWAFSNVRNVHELKQMSEEDMFIPRGKLFYRFGWYTASYKAKWIALQERFDMPDEYAEDTSLPAEFRSEGLVMDATGIQLDNQRYNWKDISGEWVEPLYRVDEPPEYVLRFEAYGQTTFYPISQLRISRFKFLRILRTYRIRAAKL